MSINENMGPIQDQYSQTYVSQYVPMPFELMQKKAEAEQKEFDTIQDNWAVISSKMGEKVLSVDKHIMTDEVSKYQNNIDEALKEVGGDWRKLSGKVKGVAAQYREFMTNGKGGQAVSRYNEMNQKNEAIDGSKLSGRMQKAQKNYINYQYNQTGGVDGNEENDFTSGRIEEPILYDESKLKENLVNFIDKLKPSKDAKIEFIKKGDPRLPKGSKSGYYTTGGYTTVKDEATGQLKITSNMVKKVDLNRIRQVAAGVMEDSVFKDKIDAEYMVGQNMGVSIPFTNDKGELEYKKENLSKDEYANYVFAKEFGFTDAYAYSQEEETYKLQKDEQAEVERKKKEKLKKAYEERGVNVTGVDALTFESKNSKDYLNDDVKTPYLKLLNDVMTGNKRYVEDFTENGVIYNTYKDNYKNQLGLTEDNSVTRKRFESTILSFFENESNELTDLVEEDGSGNLTISGEGYNQLFESIAKDDQLSKDFFDQMTFKGGDDMAGNMLNVMTGAIGGSNAKGKLFLTPEAVEEFKKIAKLKDKENYRRERLLRENMANTVSDGLTATEGSLKKLKADTYKQKDELILLNSNFAKTGLQKSFDKTNPKYFVDGKFSPEKYKKDVDNHTKAVEYFTSKLNKEHGASKKIRAPRSVVQSIYKPILFYNEIFEVMGDAFKDGKMTSENDEYNLELGELQLETYADPETRQFVENFGNGDFSKGYEVVKDLVTSSLTGAKKLSRLNSEIEVKNADKNFKERKLAKIDKYRESLKAKLETKTVVNLNYSKQLKLNASQAEQAKGAPAQKIITLKKLIDDGSISPGSYLDYDLNSATAGTEIGETTKSTMSKSFGNMRGKNGLLTKEEKIAAVKEAMSSGSFSDDRNPDTGQMEIAFTLNGLNFRMPFTINSKAPANGFGLELTGFSETKATVLEREIRNDIHKAKIDNLERYPIGNYRDGVVIRSKKAGGATKFSKNFNDNFADGGEYRVSLDPTAIGINIGLDDKTVLRNFDVPEKDAAKFIRVYKYTQTLEDNPAKLKNFQDKNPHFKGMSPSEISHDMIRKVIYESFPGQRLQAMIKDNSDIELSNYDDFANIEYQNGRGNRYFNGKGPSENMYSEGRIYSYPDGFNGDGSNKKSNAIENKRRREATKEKFLSMGVSKEEAPTKPPKRIFYPFPEKNQQSNQQADQQSDFDTTMAEVNQADKFWEAQEEKKKAPSDSTNTFDLEETLSNITNRARFDSTGNLIFGEQGKKNINSNEEIYSNVKENKEVKEQLNNLGIEGDVTPESLTTDLSEYQYEVTDAKTRETRFTTDREPVTDSFALPGQGDPLPEFMIKKSPNNFTDKFEDGGKQYDSGVIRKQNLKDFAGAANATGLVRFMAGFSNDTYYKNGNKMTDKMEIKDVKTLDCSSFTHVALDALGYDLKGSQGFKPDPNSKYQFNKQGLSPYSGAIYHNSIESKKQTFKNTNEIDLTKLKDGQIIAFDTADNFMKDAKSKKGWEGNWRQGGSSQGIDHIGVITMIDGVPYIGESSANSKMKGPGLIKLETRLKQLQHRLNKTKMKMEFKRDANDNKMYYKIPKTDKAGNTIYKTDKQGKFLLDPVTKEKIPIMVTTDQEILVKTKIRKPTIFIGEYPKKKK